MPLPISVCLLELLWQNLLVQVCSLCALGITPITGLGKDFSIRAAAGKREQKLLRWEWGQLFSTMRPEHAGVLRASRVFVPFWTATCRIK